MQHTNAKRPGQSMLLVVGILKIIVGAFGLLGAILLMTGEAAFSAAMGDLFEVNTMLGGVLTAISSVALLLAGVAACVLRQKAAHAKTLVVIGVLAAIVIGVLTLVGGGLSLMLVVELVLPALYLVGAFRNLNATQA